MEDWHNIFSEPFPAHAGMNRILEADLEAGPTVPRARGDEPTAHDGGLEVEIRSPRTRG